MYYSLIHTALFKYLTVYCYIMNRIKFCIDHKLIILHLLDKMSIMKGTGYICAYKKKKNLISVKIKSEMFSRKK